MKNWLARNGPVLLFLILLAAVWELSATLFRIPHYIIPKLSSVFISLWETKGLLYKHFGYTLWESVLGLSLSIVFGVALAVMIEGTALARKVLYPLVVASQTVPIIALSPVMVMWFGYEIWSKVAVVILFTFFPITVSTVDGFRGVDKDMIELMRTMGASKRDLFWKLKAPSALPGFFTGLKMAATVSVVGATIGEWLGAESGLGMYTKRASSQLRADAVFAGVLLLSIMGIVLFLAAKWVEGRVLSNHRRT